MLLLNSSEEVRYSGKARSFELGYQNQKKCTYKEDCEDCSVVYNLSNHLLNLIIFYITCILLINFS